MENDFRDFSLIYFHEAVLLEATGASYPKKHAIYFFQW